MKWYGGMQNLIYTLSWTPAFVVNWSNTNINLNQYSLKLKFNLIN